MNYLRQTVDSEKLVKIFDLPAEIRGREVEVIILPLQGTRKTSGQQGRAYGCLQKYADASLISEESGAWEQATVNKHACG
jgi:hypothetical protein